MERAFLRNFGLEEDQINQILDQASNDIGKKVSEYENKLATEKQKTEAKEEELSKANDTIKNLQKANKNNEDLQAQIEQYKKDIEAVQAKAQAERIDMSINLALTNAGAIEPLAVTPFIDKDKIVVGKDGTIAGIDEQIQQIVGDESKAFLFKRVEAPTPEIGGYKPEVGYVPETGTTEAPVSLGTLLGQEKANATESSTSNFWSQITP